MKIDIYLVSRKKKKDFARARGAAGELEKRLQHRPEVTLHRLKSFEDLETLDPEAELFQILGFLPKGNFHKTERQAIASFRRRHHSLPFLPIAIEPARNRPHPPFEKLRSFPLHDMNDKTVGRLVTWLEIQLGLRLASAERSIFVSYRIADGTAVAERIEDEMGRRGFKVFRDDKSDDDDLPRLEIGGDVQAQIHQEIPRHSMLLVVDTPEATESAWMREEIDVAIASLRPVLPIVIPNPPSAGGASGRQVAVGGRFQALQALQNEMRIAPETVTDPGCIPNVLDNTFFDDLEAKIRTVLLGHLQVHKTLPLATERQFEKLKFGWREERPERLLFEAEKAYKSSFRYGPKKPFRLLVQCSPYAAVLGPSLMYLEKLCNDTSADWGVLVFPDDAFEPDRHALSHYGQSVFALAPDEIGEEPWRGYA